MFAACDEDSVAGANVGAHPPSTGGRTRAGGTLPARAVVAEGGRAAAALLGTLLDEPVRRISCYAASMRAPLEKLHGREQGVWAA